MNDVWAEMLETNKISMDFKDESGAAFINNVNTDQLQLVDLSALKIYEVTGEDAQTFLQGQFCNDLSVVSSTRAQITGYCTPKGRLLALPGIVGFAQGYRLLVPGDLAEGFIKRLTMFVMRSKVSIAERTDWIATGIIANTIDNLEPVTARLGDLPVSAMDAATSDTQQIIRWHDDYSSDGDTESDPASQVTNPAGSTAEPSGAARYLILASTENQLALWDSCDKATRYSNSRWRLADISAGIPTVSAGVQESFVPQMLNLQLIDALSFTKGCYPGQEIVARMQYLGKLKRHMRLFRLSLAAGDGNDNASADSLVVKPGDKLTSDGDADAGIVVDAVRAGDQYIALLAVVKVSANSTQLSAAGVNLDALELPYMLPSLGTLAADAG